MPLQNTILQVLVASPEDVSEERALMQEVIDELNRTWADTLGVAYRLYGWDMCVAPGFASEPQEVINSQVPSEYDLFIGIFWGRLGSPTNKYPSGTVEEFERAYSRLQTTGSPEIMLYFKDAPLAPSKLDPEQIKNILEFKASLSDRGGLYKPFEDQNGFEASLRSDLSMFAARFTSRSSSRTGKSISIETLNSRNDLLGDEDLDDLGYLDYTDIYVTEMSGMTECLETINRLTSCVAEIFQKRTNEIEDVEESPSEAKRVLLMTSTDMDRYAKDLDEQLSVYSESRTKAFDSLSTLVSIHCDISGKDENLLELQSSLKHMLTSILESKRGIVDMRTAASEIPRMIKEVNVAKRKMLGSLDRFLYEIESTQDTASNIVGSIEDMI